MHASPLLPAKVLQVIAFNISTKKIVSTKKKIISTAFQGMADADTRSG